MRGIRHLILVFFILGSLSLRSQTLTLYALPSPHRINWKTPHHLVLSIANNFLTKKKHSYSLRAMGHIVVELKKNDSVILTGMVPNKNKDLFKSIFAEEYGLGVLFKLIEGHLEKKEILIPEIESRTKTGKVAFITFNINDSSYFYLKNYIDSFRRLGYDKLYNGKNDPRHGEGSGCSAFGMSFLELINALEPEFSREWVTDKAIPNKLIGGELTHSKVSILKVFFSFGWAKDKQPHTHLKLYNPGLIYSWIEKKYNDELINKLGKYRISTINLAKGIILDYQQICKPQFPMFPEN